MKKFLHDKCGATAIEYGLIVALIVIVIIGSFTLLGNSSNGLWSNVNSKVASKL